METANDQENIAMKTTGRPIFALALTVAMAMAMAMAIPAVAHIPKHCYDLVAKRMTANEAAANGVETLADMVFARMPMFMIDQAVVEASELLKENAFAELRLVECLVDAE